MWKLIHDSSRPHLSVKSSSENIWKISLRQIATFFKLQVWLNQHNDYNKVQQNLEYRFTGLHLSKAFLSGLICWDGVYFQERLFREYKNKLDKSEKSWENLKRF